MISAQIRPCQSPTTDTKGRAHTHIIAAVHDVFIPAHVSHHLSLSDPFSSIIFPWLPEGTCPLKWTAVFAQGREGLSVSWTSMVIPSLC